MIFWKATVRIAIVVSRIAATVRASGKIMFLLIDVVIKTTT